MIKDFTPRLYQQTILATAAKANTLVVLPTGMGKTNIFLMLAAQRLSLYPNTKILFLGPTKPLIDQYKAVFEKHFDIEPSKLVTLTGMIAPERRAELWQAGTIIFSTPQGLENDILTKRITLSDVSLLGVDEAHRASGDYAYVFLAKVYMEQARYPRILALTASPGSEVQTIQEVCKNLHIAEIEVRTDQDPDVKPYVQDIDVQWMHVVLPAQFQKIREELNHLIKDRLGQIKSTANVNINIERLGKKELLALQGQLHSQVMQGEKDFSVLRAISLLAEVMKASHGLELIETQGVQALKTYMDKLEEQSRSSKVKAVANLVKDANWRSARYLCNDLFEKGIEHPKVPMVRKIVTDALSAAADAKIIIFTQYRDTASALKAAIPQKSEIFVGQMKKGETGMSQKEQKRLLDSFRAGEFPVLISTSIGEEGLDVPNVDLVLFYEPVPSAIRSIQRRGRTGRQEKGNVIVLIAKGTRDEGYRWSAHHKEASMHRTLSGLKAKIGSLQQPVQQKLAPLGLKMLVDFREKGSGVLKQLLALNVDVELRQLPVADVMVSGRCGIEIKTVEDFVDSIIDGRLLSQLRMLKELPRPVVLVIGESELYSVRKVHPNAINGMLATITVSYGIPLIRVRTEGEAAQYLIAVAKREQEEGDTYSSHFEKKVGTLKEAQEYVIGALPGVGPQLAKPLLRKFGSVKGVINASEEELREVDLIGEKKSKDIKHLTDGEYKE